jgi:hypothetical protein
MREKCVTQNACDFLRCEGDSGSSHIRLMMLMQGRAKGRSPLLSFTFLMQESIKAQRWYACSDAGPDQERAEEAAKHFFLRGASWLSALLDCSFLRASPFVLQ